MKNSFILLSLFASLFSFGQSTLDKTIVSGGVVRSYKIYIPASYSSTVPVPLVFNFHGLGSNSLQQMLYGDFRSIADTANFIVVHPQGTTSTSLGATFWNAYFGQAVNDFGFVLDLINTISSDYSINPDRIHSTGMSNGGYMSLALASEFDNLFASVASVTGSMTRLFPISPTNTKPISVLQIHGTADSTVKYLGDAASHDISYVIDYWKNHNNTSSTPFVDSIPNVSTIDNCDAKRYTYGSGINNTEVIHYKVFGGAHTWPGAPIPIGVTNQDFNASEVIWRFFDKHPRSSSLSVSELNQKVQFQFVFKSSFNELVITNESQNQGARFRVINALGQIVIEGKLEGRDTSLNLNDSKPGVYIAQVFDAQNTSQTFKFTKH